MSITLMPFSLTLALVLMLLQLHKVKKVNFIYKEPIKYI